MLEEIDVIVASLLDTLLRTILEITSRPQPSGSSTRLQFQDVTVRSQSGRPLGPRVGALVRVSVALGGGLLQKSRESPPCASALGGPLGHAQVWAVANQAALHTAVQV